MEALCLSFVCHLVCELLLFEPPPPPKKYRGKLLLFSRGRGDGPTTLSAYSLLLMHGLLLFARPTPGRAHLQASDLPCACYPHCFCHLVLGPCWGRYVCPLCATSCMSCCCSSPPPKKNWVKLLLFSRGRGDGSTTLSASSLLLVHGLLLFARPHPPVPSSKKLVCLVLVPLIVFVFRCMGSAGGSMSVLCVPPRVRVVVLRAPPTPEKNWVKLLLFSRGRGDGSTTLSPYSLLLMHWLLLPSLFLSSGAWEVLEALCLSFVCHLVCELLFFEPLPSRKKLGQVVVVLAGPGGWVYHSFSLLFAPHALAVVSIIVVVVRCVRSGGGSMSVLCVPPPVRVVVVRPPPEKKSGQVVVVLAGPGGWAYHSFCLLFAPHARAVALAVVVGVGVGGCWCCCCCCCCCCYSMRGAIQKKTVSRTPSMIYIWETSSDHLTS